MTHIKYYLSAFFAICTMILFAGASLATSPPTISPAYGVFSSSKTVTISAGVGSTIYYTTDGSTPTTGSPVYSSGFSVTTSKTVKAIAVISGVSSSVTSAYIQIDSSIANIPTSGLILWLKADNGVSTSASNVTQWLDMSSNAYNAAQANSSNQPTYVSNAVNGLPAVSFNGTSSFLQLPSTSAGYVGSTIFIVTKPTAVTAGARFFDFGNGVANNNLYISEPTNTGASLHIYTTTTDSSITSSSAITLSQYQVLEASVTTSHSSTILTNGVQGASGTTNVITNTTRTGNFIGTNYANTLFFDGEIAEMLIFNTALSASNFSKVQGYLYARYGLFVDAPTISPGYGVFSGSTAITLADVDPGAQIYYTTDGSTPTTGSNHYTAPFNVTSSKTIKAIAVQSFGNSTVSSAYIQIDSTVANVPQGFVNYWYKADNGVTTSGSNVTQWLDMSSNANNAIQSNSSNQPGYLSSDINGLPAISFNGSSQFMALMNSSSLLDLGADIFIVTKPVSVTTNARLLDFGNGETSDNVSLSEPTSTGLSFNVYNGSSASSLTSSSAITLNQYQLVQAYHNSAGAASILTNGVQNARGTLNNMNLLTRTGNFIGTDYNNALFFDGNIAEVIICSPLTAIQQYSIQGYLMARYQIGVDAPAITPGYGCFSTSQTVTMAGDPGAQIYYTTDGSTPTTGSTHYTGGFSVTSSKTVKAIAVQSFGTSSVASAYIQIDSSTAIITKGSLALWLKADNGVFTSGSNVSQWLDMSTSNANNAVQSNSSNQPTLVTNAVNSLPAVSFSGSSQFLQLGATGLTSFISGGSSIFVVTQPTAAATNARLFDFATGETANNINMLQPTSTGLTLTANTASVTSSLTSSTAVALNQYQLLEGTISGSSSAIYSDESQVATGTLNSIPTVARTGSYIGTDFNNSVFYQGQIAELMVYNGALTGTARTNVEGYLVARYAITVTPPRISPSTGVYLTNQTVTLTADPGAQIYYTLDGTTPTTSSTHYTGSFTASGLLTPINAIAVQPFGNSTVSSSFIQVDPSTMAVSRTNLLLWLKADGGVATSGSSVSQLSDMSGNGNNATQSNSSNQPTFATSAINSLPAVNFNGSSQFLQMGSGFTNFHTGVSIFAVTKPTSTTGGYVLDIGNGAASDNLTLSNSGSGTTATFSTYSGITGSTLNASSALTLNQYQLLEASQTGSGSGTILVNGQQGATGSLNNLSILTRTLNHLCANYNGSSNFYQGGLAEVLLYNTNLTTSQKAAVEAYLMQKYQLQSLVPPSPIISVAGGTLTSPTQVAISTIGGATIYFTTDGTTPTTGSNLYTGPINVYFSQTIKAIAVISSGMQSSVASAAYTLDSTQWPAPSSSDPTALNLNLQLPTTTAPQ